MKDESASLSGPAAAASKAIKVGNSPEAIAITP